MDFYQLEALIAVAEQGSFSRAAERLFRTQSAISQAVKKLEDQLGSPLFDRRAPSLVPTDTGRVVLDYARRIVSLRTQALDAVDELRRAPVGRVTIAAIESAAQYVVPELLRVFYKKHPALEIEVQRWPNSAIAGQLLDRVAEIGFAAAEPPLKRLNTIELFSDPLVLIVAPQHDLAARPEVEVKDLAEERFFIHHVKAQTTQRVIALFEANRTPLHIAARLSSYEDVKEFVKENVGVAIVPAISVHNELRSGELVRVPVVGFNISRRICALYGEEQYLSTVARELIDLLRQGTWSWSVTSPVEKPADHPRLSTHSTLLKRSAH